MNTRSTPETDAAWACFKGYMEPLQDVQDLSRKLERQRDEARETIATMEIRHAAVMLHTQSIVDEANQFRDQRDGMEEKLRIELRGHPNSKLWGDAGLIAATMRCVDALDVVTAQRDRLAEALQDLVASCNCIDSVDFMPVSMPEAFEKAQQALQSLTPKP